MKTRESNLTYMQYKGLYGTVGVDLPQKRLCGHVVGTSDKISYEASNLEELEAEFHEAVDDYIEFCRSRGKEPEKSFTGNILLRATPEMHGSIVKKAHDTGKSVNAWILEVVSAAVSQNTR